MMPLRSRRSSTDSSPSGGRTGPAGRPGNSLSRLPTPTSKPPRPLPRSTDGSVARVDRDTQAGRGGDLAVVGDEAVRIRVDVVRGQDEDAIGARVLGAPREERALPRSEADAGDDGDAPIGRLDRRLDDGAAFVR